MRATSTAVLSIGALSRASGIPVPTLRTWERRYGYPQADRKPSGHRVYSAGSVPRLRRVAAALARGHRAGEVLTASDAALDEILVALPPASPAPPRGAVDLDELLAAVRDHDGALLMRRLGDYWSRLGPLAFCRDGVAPLLEAIGHGWATDSLEVRHEHFASERLTDVMRSIRLPYEDRAAGPLVVLATPPGELHGLGLQMVALLLAVHGCRPCLLGTDLPIRQTADLAREQRARAVAIGISSACAPRAVRRHVQALRAALPSRMSLVVGGAGAEAVAARNGITILRELDAVDAWARDRLVRT